MAKFKAAIITDIHRGPSKKSKLGSTAPRLLKAFKKALPRHRVDAVINIGDDIVTDSKKKALKYLKQVTNIFNHATMPYYKVLGNWDVMFLSRAENEAVTKCPSDSYSIDMNGYHFVFLNPSPAENTGKEAKDRFRLSDEDIAWVKQDLATTTLPTIIFSHVPLDDVSQQLMDSSALEENKKITNRFGFAEKGPKLRAILEESGKVILCMSGHLHRNAHREINGIHYVTQQSLTKWAAKDSKIPMNAYSILEITDTQISIKIKGKVKMGLELTPRVMP